MEGGIGVGGVVVGLALLLWGCAATSEVEEAADDDVLLAYCDDLKPQPIVDGPLSDDVTVATAQQARAAFSVPSDRETVEAIMAGERGSLASGFSFPVLESELAARESQDPSPGRAEDVVDVVLAYVDSTQAAADAFGQMWIDNTRGGLHVGSPVASRRTSPPCASDFRPS